MGYVYQADVYCDSCGESIVKELTGQGKAPEDSLDHSSFDSDYFPKSYDHRREDSDSPQHCAECGDFLRNPLTQDGYQYVQSALGDLPALTSLHKLRTAGHSFLAEWASWYDFTYWDAEDCEDYGRSRRPGWYSREMAA